MKTADLGIVFQQSLHGCPQLFGLPHMPLSEKNAARSSPRKSEQLGR